MCVERVVVVGPVVAESRRRLEWLSVRKTFGLPIPSGPHPDVRVHAGVSENRRNTFERVHQSPTDNFKPGIRTKVFSICFDSKPTSSHQPRTLAEEKKTISPPTWLKPRSQSDQSQLIKERDFNVVVLAYNHRDRFHIDGSSSFVERGGRPPRTITMQS